MLTDEFIKLFEEYGIDYKAGLQSQIVSQNEKTFYEKLLQLFRLTLQMRNSITNSEVDYLISPVMNYESEFYDSRQAGNKLPKDADANGAYHIAKKGWLLLERIKDWDENSKPDLLIKNKAWLEFAQSNSKS